MSHFSQTIKVNRYFLDIIPFSSDISGRKGFPCDFEVILPFGLKWSLNRPVKVFGCFFFHSVRLLLDVPKNIRERIQSRDRHHCHSEIPFVYLEAPVSLEANVACCELLQEDNSDVSGSCREEFGVFCDESPPRRFQVETSPSGSFRMNSSGGHPNFVNV